MIIEDQKKQYQVEIAEK